MSETVEELLACSEPYTREEYDRDMARVLARCFEKHGVSTREALDEIIRAHAYYHDPEDIEDGYIQLMAMARAAGWP